MVATGPYGGHWSIYAHIITGFLIFPFNFSQDYDNHSQKKIQPKVFNPSPSPILLKPFHAIYYRNLE
jgi:hypothetical protein